MDFEPATCPNCGQVEHTASQLKACLAVIDCPADSYRDPDTGEWEDAPECGARERDGAWCGNPLPCRRHGGR